MYRERMTVGRWLAALVFPERCVCCGEPLPLRTQAAGFCETCAVTVEPVASPVCPFCGSGRNRCTCRNRRRHFVGCVSAFYYEGALADGVRRFKRAENRMAAHFFAGALAEAIRQRCEGIPLDGIVPVPLAKQSEKKRGYNQSMLLAEALSARLGLPVLSALVKIQETAPQKSLPALARSGNVLGVFELSADVDVKGKALLLVDDLLTTGATLDECAKMLKISGADSVTAAVIATTVIKG